MEPVLELRFALSYFWAPGELNLSFLVKSSSLISILYVVLLVVCVEPYFARPIAEDVNFLSGSSCLFRCFIFLFLRFNSFYPFL